jgi:allophanate hydrolase subunit 2
VTGGPELGEYDEQELAGPWTVSAQSDAVGLRTEGPTPTRSTSREILSRGVPVGAVEVPPGGGLLILLHGRLITAGYPVPYVATTAGIDRLGQARPGDVLVLRQVPLAEAVAQGHARRRGLVQLAQRAATALGSSGLGEHVRPGHLSERA